MKKQFASISTLIKSLGPGLIYAGAAVGVSHLVQSTKAGALYGWALLPGILIAHLVKFFAFDAASRYAWVSGKSLLHGYRTLGHWAVAIFVLMTLSTMLIVQSAVLCVTSALCAYLLPVFDMQQWSFIIICLCVIILGGGAYYALHTTMKILVLCLSVGTVCSLFLCFFDSTSYVDTVFHAHWFPFSSERDVLFLAAFLGWMPAPMEVTVWSSIWSSESYGEKEYLTFRQARTDFHIGYWGTALLAVCFLLLGAFVLYSPGKQFPEKGTEFAATFISLYGSAIGTWAVPLISLAALSTMVSTTFTCLDGSARALVESAQECGLDQKYNSLVYSVLLVLVTFGTLGILFFTAQSMGAMVQFATMVAFLGAPVIAFLNHKVIWNPQTWNQNTKAIECKPPPFWRYLSIASVVLLLGLSGLYLMLLL